MNAVSRFAADRLLAWLAGPPGGDGGREIRLEKFGIAVADDRCRRRILAVLRAFFGGFEVAVKSPSELAAGAGELDRIYLPFYHEGAAMGFGAGQALRLRRWRAAIGRFEREAIPRGDPFVFLRYVGLGFWLGFRLGGSPRRLDGAAALLRERRYRHLAHDGYGFHTGFFLLPKDGGAAVRLRRLGGFGRASAFNGLGRSLWFFHMDRPEAALEHARSFGEDGDAVVGGLGLAAAFTWIDDLRRAYTLADGLAPRDRGPFIKGIRIALYVRWRSDEAHLEDCIAGLDAGLARRARGDLDLARRVGEETSQRDDFIASFHAGCLGS
jgi:hypothetical protein